MTLKLHASRLVDAIPESLRLALSTDPETALSGLSGIRVMSVPQLRDSRGAGGWCDGLSFMNDGIICYAPSLRSRRQNFTLLHEFGHLCVDGDDDALDWLADRADPPADLERLCDAIAEAGLRRITAILMDMASPGGLADDRFRRAGESPLDAARVPEPIACPACGQASARSSYPCEECGAPPCPACGRCPCP